MSGSPLVEIDKASKIYRSPRGATTAIADVTVQIGDGEFVAVVGPSGCGKCTLLKCVAGLEPLSSGEIRVRGERVDGPPDGLGAVFQRDVLMDWRTALDNVLLPAEFLGLRRADFLPRARELLGLVGLADRANSYPWELSGGMRQRVAIARALLCRPVFLLMDEPFGALDALTRDELNVELQRIWLAEKNTVLFITHGIEEAVFLADRVLVMDRDPGRVALDLEVALPRPRPIAVRDEPAFAAHTAKVRAAMPRAGASRAA